MITPKITAARKRESGSGSDALTSYANSRSKTRTSKPKDRQFRVETDSLGEVKVAADRLWGAQTQRSLEHFSIGKDLIPREMITAYATLKKGAAKANHAGKRLDDKRYRLIVQTCDEILAGQHEDMFPLHVWMTGSGTQFNMNVNEVISNRCCQLAGTPLGSKTPVHPNDHVNMSQSSNDSFPSAMNIAAGVNVKQRLIPAVKALHDAIAEKVEQWKDVIKIGRTHMQDATPLTLGQEWSSILHMSAADLDDVLPLLNLLSNRIVQRLHCRDKPLLHIDRRRDVHCRGKRVVGRLGHVDVVVGMHRGLAPKRRTGELAAPVGDHLVHVHVELRTAARHPHMQGEHVVMLTREDLVADLNDQLVTLIVEPLAGIIGIGGAFL